MAGLLKIAVWEGYLLLGSFAVIVLLKLLNGTISLRGLLRGQREEITASRAQMMAITLFGAMYYLLQVMRSSEGALPHVPTALIGTVGGSQAVYLAGKAWSLFGKKKRS